MLGLGSNVGLEGILNDAARRHQIYHQFLHLVTLAEKN